MNCFYNEIDPGKAEWLRQLMENGVIQKGIVDERSIEVIKPEELDGYTRCGFFAGIGIWDYALQLAGWPDDSEAWNGSCPCQPFSVAGQRKGEADERHLWPAWFNLISQRRPLTVFGEQVSDGDGQAWLDTVQLQMESVGYRFGSLTLPSASLGAPHGRHRTFFVADTRSTGREARSFNGRSGKEISGGVATIGSASRSKIGRICNDGLLVHDQQAGLEGHGRNGVERDQPGWNGTGPNGSTATPSAVNGFWADAEWVPCRGEIPGAVVWRPIERRLVALPHGASTNLLYRSNSGSPCIERKEEEKVNDTNQTNSDKTLPTVRNQTGTETIREKTGGSIGIQQENLLQPGLHGESDGEGDLRQHFPQPNESPSKHSESVRDMWGQHFAASCSSPGSESQEQRPVEFADFVRLLPQSYSLAQLCGDATTQKGLQMLQETLGEKWFVQHASNSPEKIWRSLSNQNKDRVRMAYDSCGWYSLGVFPLVKGAEARALRLKGYGDGLVLQVAVEFIKAYLEIRNQEL